MIADIVVIVLIAFFAYIGYKKGFVKMVSKLCCIIVAVIVAKVLHPVVSVFVMESALGDFIRDKVSIKADSALGEMPVFLQDAGNHAVNSVADSIISIVTIILIIVVTYFASKIIVGALNVVAKFPGISFFNRLSGMVIGAVFGAFVVCLIISVLKFTNFVNIQEWLEGSVIAYTIYRENILMNLIF